MANHLVLHRQHFDRGYAIQPHIDAGTVPDLAHLQNDVQVIADGLWDGVMSIAGEWEEKAERLLNHPA
ncbi:hypothetical protein CS022_18430 [Veronia nyctiphanis]|uniref:Uncharacterized protein n=2 Tax=Veronia nyctiphanis TaxID=1278244 RepID=A0A4Q0YMK2_9GAMM|nr:hypothetical protein CS022_18430 [Veronia nyctiphanis]